ncbi:MAG: 2-dehydropantoate 2-reductase [Leptospira sp.]|nr:2-dehydropantoate 2-reductase [Leptospira sp.]
MKISIIGTGAVGGFYGSILAASGNEVHFLVRSDYEHCRQYGLKLTSPMGDLQVYPHDVEKEDAKYKAYFWNDPQDLPVDSDFIIIAIKATENEKLPFLLQSFKNKNATILLIQNGLGQENHIHVQLPMANRVFGGLAFLCSVKEAPGHIHHIDYGDLTIAESIPGGSPAEIDMEIEKLGKAFRNARISVTIESDLLLARWQKLIWNIPFNGLSVILNASTEEIITHPNSLNLVRDIMKEVQKVAASENKSISDAFIEERIQRTFKMKPYTPSMKLDYDNKRPMELEAIYLDPLLRAEIKGIKIPKIQTLYQQLSYLEYRNLSQN